MERQADGSQMPLLVADGVAKVYRTGDLSVQALADLDLTVGAGELVAVMARSMGFVFQSFNLIPVFTALENVELPLLLVGFSPKVSRTAAQEMLARVGLGHRGDHLPNQMSGGEQQRVTIARALVGRPAIVWADEPTGNLDTSMAAQVMELLLELNQEQGQTIVLVTHDQAIGRSAGRLLLMRDGRLLSDERHDDGVHQLPAASRR
jgi:putative ABC transport system ATP-binding protein